MLGNKLAWSNTPESPDHLSLVDAVCPTDGHEAVFPAHNPGMAIDDE